MSVAQNITITKPNNSLSLAVKTIEDWAEIAEEIKVELKNGKRFRIHMSDFLLECKRRNGRLVVPKGCWEEVSS